MKNKIKKFNKTSQDYKAKKIGIISCCMAIASVGILIPAAEQYKKENLALNQQIELLLNDDVQDVQIEEIDEDAACDIYNEKWDYANEAFEEIFGFSRY